MRGVTTFFFMQSASHQILAGNSTFTSYTLGLFACQFRFARILGQNCTLKFTREKQRVGLVEFSEGATQERI